MTQDPARILNAGSHAEPFERSLLKSIHDVSPSVGAKDEAWSRIAERLGASALALGGATVASRAAGKAVAGATAKAGLVNAASQSLAVKVTIGLILAGGSALVATRPVPLSSSVSARPTPPNAGSVLAPGAAPAAPNSQAASASVDSGPAKAAVQKLADSSPTPQPQAPASRPMRAATRPAARDDIARESALLSQARAELRGGDARAADATLSRLRAEFPNGALGQEREVLAIELLSVRGNSAAAKRRAQSFVLAHPSSPHNAALARLLSRE